MGILSSVIKFFEGRVKIYADDCNKDALLSFFVDNGISAKISSCNEKGGIYTEISPSLLKKIAPALDKLNIMVYIINIYGFKRICSKYGKRYGLLCGFFIFAALLWISTLFVWRIDIIGNELISKEQISAELSEMGVKVGSKISDIDRQTIASYFLKEHPELSWAALNFKGTTVILNLKETESRPDEVTENGPLLVASEGGVIKSILVYEGSAVVKVGTVVKKGDVLITGLISGSGMQITDVPPLRVENAVGSVKAEITRTQEVVIPFSEKFTFSEPGENKGKIISVFGHDFLFGSTDGAVLESEKNVTFFGVLEIPITVKTYVEQKTVTRSISRENEEARIEAERQLYKKITDSLGDGELTFVKTEYTETETGWTARAQYGCIVEIAVPSKGLTK